MSPNREGQHLAELPRYFHEYRAPYLEWAAVFERPRAESLAHYRRALIGWYEARIAPQDPYLGRVYDYVTTIADRYFSGENSVATYQGLVDTDLPLAQNALNYLPRTVHLDETQQLMLRQFHAMGKSCQDVLLMADYHHLDATAIGKALEIPGQLEEVRSRRRKCMLMAREGWQSTGILDPVLVPSPADEQLIDRYFANQLNTTERWEVEARRPVDSVFRRGMELREDWMDVITVAGRQDLMETLEREEARHGENSNTATNTNKSPGQRSGEPAAPPPNVKLSKRSRRTPNLGKISVPGAAQSLLSVVLLAGFLYLLYDTFGGNSSNARYAAYFEPFPNIFNRYEPQTAEERDLEDILYYYDRRDYRNAYEELLPVADAYPAAPLYLGVSALALDQPARAQDWLVRIQPGEPYYQHAQWYEALATLGTGSRPGAASILEEIVRERRHPYRQRAMDLLEEL